MIKKHIKLIKTLNLNDDGEPLLNGISILFNDNLVIADGGNNKISLFNPEGSLLKSIGDFGYDRYKFKEPVGVFVSPDNKIYVMDWHNHRVVIYDEDLHYINEFGHYGKLNGHNILKIYLGFIKQLSSKGSYYKYHYNVSKAKERLYIKKNRFTIFLEGLKYWIYLNNSFIKSFHLIKDKQFFLNKPNGITFIDNNLYLTQKKNNCISIYENSDHIKLVKNIKTLNNKIKFNRLGNIKSNYQNRLFICDEGANKIFVCDKDFKIIKVIGGKNDLNKRFKPFSCEIINDKLLAVCGGYNFQIISWQDNEVIFKAENLGELHGIAYNNRLNLIYLVSRSRGLIYIYKREI